MNSLLSRLSVRNRIWMMVALLMGSILASGLIDILTVGEGQIGHTLLFVAGSGAVLLLIASLIASSITRHSLEAEVASQTMRMRALIDAANESILLLDADGGILSINAFGANRFGKQPEDITGKNFFALLPKSLAKERSALVQSVFTSGQPQHAQDVRGGVFFSNSLYPVKNAAGVVESVAVFAKDVTEQHQTREVDTLFSRLDAELLKSRMDLESIAHRVCQEVLPLFDLAGAWIGRTDKNGKILLVANAPDSMHSNNQAHSALTLPLSLRGATWGALCLYGRTAHQFEAKPLSQRLTGIATRLGFTLESAMQQ
jgi:PAS domain S-box-containing protein